MSGDRPDAAELVDAVARWLTDEHAPAVKGASRFQALVAAQALAIVSRELALGAAHDAADAAALGALTPTATAADGAAARQALADALRAGDHDEDLAAVAAVLREHVRRKLDLARPGYDAG
ncbi:DUF6285 domain-containing protein [Paraconexibacter antarcticus]|uniref:DUF6285 domain-containing protein n=1 Tax=Paraconexibacter antarcticus TaxID=2949664 RepID=A0ABY5DT28_9ACTN|nr:DUF6285 domain-containing protein [Paraconexibacter antarcticus]UTI65178.1 DUF6285 domain-containing protein [Paraconexibacter antarcticus]